MPSVIANVDQPMADAPNAEGDSDVASEMDHPDATIQKIRVLPGAGETAASFEIEDEDHTMGNALRYMIMKNPDVELCGYSIPHPSEAKMNLRIQTYENTTVYDVLEKGLNDLMGLCDVITEKFTIARDEFNVEKRV